MTEISIYCNRNFQIALGASIVMMMMVATIVPAFPKVMEAFKLTEQSVGLLITVHTLPGFLFAPLGGIVADRLDRKKLLVGSLLLFGIFGGSCALAPDFNTLLILRALQGIGAAPLLSISATIISDIFSGHKRAEALGINTTVMYTGYIIYPLIGGALAGLTWNYPFLLFLAAIPLGLLAIFALQYPEPRNRQSLGDYLGDALHYLKNWKVVWLFSATVITYVLLYGAYLTYFSILIAERFHASPLTVGLFVSAVGLFTAIISSQVGRISKRFSVVSLIISAFVIYAIAMAIIPVMPELWFCLLPAIAFGIAHGLNLPSMTVVASQVTPPEHRASFMAIHGTMILLGMTIAPLVIGLAFSLTNLNVTFIIAALIALIIPIMAVIISRKRLSA